MASLFSNINANQLIGGGLSGLGALFASNTAGDAAANFAADTSPVNTRNPFGDVQFSGGQFSADLNPQAQGLFRDFLSGGRSNLQNASQSQDAFADRTFGRLNQLSGPGELQNRQTLNDNLFAQGRLGSTGGALEQQALFRAQADANTGRALTADQLAFARQGEFLNRALGNVGGATALADGLNPAMEGSLTAGTLTSRGSSALLNAGLNNADSIAGFFDSLGENIFGFGGAAAEAAAEAAATEVAGGAASQAGRLLGQGLFGGQGAGNLLINGIPSGALSLGSGPGLLMGSSLGSGIGSGTIGGAGAAFPGTFPVSGLTSGAFGSSPIAGAAAAGDAAASGGFLGGAGGAALGLAAPLAIGALRFATKDRAEASNTTLGADEYFFTPKRAISPGGNMGFFTNRGAFTGTGGAAAGGSTTAADIHAEAARQTAAIRALGVDPAGLAQVINQANAEIRSGMDARAAQGSALSAPELQQSLRNVYGGHAGAIMRAIFGANIPIASDPVQLRNQVSVAEERRMPRDRGLYGGGGPR